MWFFFVSVDLAFGRGFFSRIGWPGAAFLKR
jgi:hypothetical protein